MYYISFIYRINDNSREFGKANLEYISDDHDGLDYEIQFVIGRLQSKLEKHFGYVINNISIGIIGTSDDFSSSDEKNVFDLYINERHNEYECFYKGYLIK